MKTKLPVRSLIFAACSLAVAPAFAVPGDVVLRKVKTTISVDMAPTPSAPPAAAGSAIIKVNQVNGVASGAVKLTVEGLAPGGHKVVATKADMSTAVIAGFRATKAGVPAEPGKDDGKIVRRLPAAVNGTLIAGLTIVDANSHGILEGDATVDSTIINFIANVAITGSSSSFPRGLHGHAVAHSKLENGVETQRQFVWVAFGAPPATQLTINVDGTPVGTVTSTNQGKVSFFGLDASVDLTAMHLITLTNASNAVVMQAEF